MKRIVLAYSGSLMTSAAIAWLARHDDVEIVTVTLDIGQARELAAVRERALSLGAVRAHVIDAKEEFVRDFVLPSLQAGAVDAQGEPLVIALSRPLIARRLVELARMESANAVAHAGEPGSAGEIALHETIRSLNPDLEVLTPAREWGMSAAELEAFARERNIPVPIAEAYRAEATLWGRLLSTADGGAVPEDAFTLTRPPADCRDEGATVEIDFAAGVPVRANGVEMSLIEMIDSLETIAGAHGVGRIPSGAAVVEAPAAAVLHAAHRELEACVIGADLADLKAALARVYTGTITSGRWFSDSRQAIDAFASVVQQRVTGSVRVKLAGGQYEVAGCSSANQVQPSGASPSHPKAVA